MAKELAKRKRAMKETDYSEKELNLNATDWLLNYINNITEYDY